MDIEKKETFTCSLKKTDFDRYHRVCEYYKLTMDDVCGILIREFVSSHYDLEKSINIFLKEANVEEKKATIEEALADLLKTLRDM